MRERAPGVTVSTALCLHCLGSNIQLFFFLQTVGVWKLSENDVTLMI